MEFWIDYGAFALKTLTLVLAVLFAMGGLVAISARGRGDRAGTLKVTKVNQELEDYELALNTVLLDKEQMKQRMKADAKKAKEAKKQAKILAKKPEIQERARIDTQLDAADRHAKEASMSISGTSIGNASTDSAPAHLESSASSPMIVASENQQISDETRLFDRKSRVFVLDFEGDLKASGTAALSKAITAVLMVAKKGLDEVVLRLESPGGLVNAYGLATSELQRIRDQDLKLTVCVDKIAASGGYMMAAVGQKILSAPFAVLGSIGVVAQLPNFHRLLKKNAVDVELFTAGEYKRTVTLFGENTDKGRRKFQADLNDTHQLFKNFIHEMRPQIKIDEVADGAHWYGSQALSHCLVDELKTSAQYLLERSREADVFQVQYCEKKSWSEKLGFVVATSFRAVMDVCQQKSLKAHHEEIM